MMRMISCSDEDLVQEDGSEMTPLALYAWCTRLMYHRRTKFNPLLTSVVVAGMENDQPYVDNASYFDKISLVHCVFM
jgi:20S proteasome alpha/beta subunit